MRVLYDRGARGALLLIAVGINVAPILVLWEQRALWLPVTVATPTPLLAILWQLALLGTLAWFVGRESQWLDLEASAYLVLASLACSSVGFATASFLAIGMSAQEYLLLLVPAIGIPAARYGGLALASVTRRIPLRSSTVLERGTQVGVVLLAVLIGMAPLFLLFRHLWIPRGTAETAFVFFLFVWQVVLLILIARHLYGELPLDMDDCIKVLFLSATGSLLGTQAHLLVELDRSLFLGLIVVMPIDVLVGALVVHSLAEKLGGNSLQLATMELSNFTGDLSSDLDRESLRRFYRLKYKIDSGSVNKVERQRRRLEAKNLSGGDMRRLLASLATQQEIASVLNAPLLKKSSGLSGPKYFSDTSQRYTRIRFPARCVRDERVSLYIQLTLQVPRDSVLASIVDVPFPHGSSAAYIFIHVTAPGFRLDTPVRSMKIPRKENSEEVTLVLTPTAVGLHIVEIEFFCQANRFGYYTLQTEVVPS